jgi:effector-binding domain-containing protein
MIDKPEIVHTEHQPTATLRVTVPRAEIQKVMGPGLQEVHAAVAAQNAGVAGPWFTHHLRMDPAVFDFEICVPVERPIVASGRVQPGAWPAMKVVRTVYHGPYEGLGAAWHEFVTRIDAEGLSPAPDFWERYLAGPESGPDPAGWRTELSRPLNG